MIAKSWVMVGATSGFLSVAFGAFGAHALSARLSEKSLAIYQTGVHYQFMHALAIVALGIWASQNPSQSLWITTRTAGWFFLIGTILFSGSLYALALTGVRALGIITPFGGLAFLVGWVSFAIAAWYS